MGETINEIGTKFAIPTSRVQAILASPEAQEILSLLRDNVLNSMLEVNSMAQAIAPTIMERKIHLALNSADERVQDKACTDLLHMAVGTPTKKVQISHTDPVTERHKDMSEDDLREALRRKLGVTGPDGRLLN